MGLIQIPGGWRWKGGMAIDADGSPRAYHPPVAGALNPGLDYLANAGSPDNWWGIACDDEGKPYIQGVNAPVYDASTAGFYVSTTTYERKQLAHNDPRRYLNSEKELFVVVPASFRKTVPGIVIGSLCIVRFAGKEARGISGDTGPRFGEASIAMADELGIDSNAKRGGVVSGVEYDFFPGTVVDGYELQAA